MNNGIEKRSRDAYLLEMASKVQSERTREYIIERIIPQMKWYSDKSNVYQKCYYRWMTASILLSAAIPVVSIFADGSIVIKLIISVFGAAVTAISAYLGVKNYKDLWRTYRNVRESLLKVLYYYFNDAGMFAQIDLQAKKDILLIDTCEKELSREMEEWLSIKLK